MDYLSGSNTHRVKPAHISSRRRGESAAERMQITSSTKHMGAQDSDAFARRTSHETNLPYWNARAARQTSQMREWENVFLAVWVLFIAQCVILCSVSVFNAAASKPSTRFQSVIQSTCSHLNCATRCERMFVDNAASTIALTKFALCRNSGC